MGETLFFAVGGALEELVVLILGTRVVREAGGYVIKSVGGGSVGVTRGFVSTLMLMLMLIQRLKSLDSSKSYHA